MSRFRISLLSCVAVVSVIGYAVYMAQQWGSGALTPLALSIDIVCAGIGYAIPMLVYHFVYAKDQKAEQEQWALIEAYQAELLAYQDLCQAFQSHINALKTQLALARRTKETYQPFSES